MQNASKDLAKTLRSGGTSVPFIYAEQEGDKLAIKIRQDGKQGGKATPADSISQTVLGGINSVDFPHAFAVKEELKSWQFLKLNPEDLREPTKQEPGMKDFISPSGKNLAAALFRIKQTNDYSLVEISRKLNSFLPEFIEVNVYDEKADKNVSIHFSNMRTLIADRDGKRIRLNISKIIPVFKENEKQTTIDFPIQEKKLSLTAVRNYLQTSNFGLTLNELDSFLIFSNFCT